MLYTTIGLIISGMIGYLLGKSPKRQRKYETSDIDNEGELLVIRTLKQNFNKKTNYLMNNVTLPIYDNGSTQIDHILINEYGIFVIETKHYSGWIFGNEVDYKWCQKFLNGRKFKFLNPIKQNQTHINHLKRYLDFISSKEFISIIVFTGNGTVKTQTGKNVISLEELTNQIQAHHKKVFNLNEIYKIIGKLEYYRKEEKPQTDQEHIAYLNRVLKR
jgi:hypothetical protein